MGEREQYVEYMLGLKERPDKAPAKPKRSTDDIRARLAASRARDRRRGANKALDAELGLIEVEETA